jgi:hypothetical protein
VPSKRRTTNIDTKLQVLHEAGYRCSNPTCRTIITLDIHHLEYVSKGGDNNPSNLLALCPNCHQLHHKGHIPEESIRAWKMLQLTLNEAFDRYSIDILLALDNIGGIIITGDGLLQCSALLASNLVSVTDDWIATGLQKVEDDHSFTSFLFKNDWKYVDKPISTGQYYMSLTNKGKALVAAWKNGNQNAAINVR